MRMGVRMISVGRLRWNRLYVNAIFSDDGDGEGKRERVTLHLLAL